MLRLVLESREKKENLVMTPKMKIGDRIISADTPPLVIAEIGINHHGDLEVAKSMVHAAFKSGCEAIKHQTHFVDDEMTLEARNVFPDNDEDGRSIWDIIEQSALTKDEEIELKNFTESLGLIYISTPFSRAAADFLNDIDIPAFKIGSGECNHLPLIRHISQFGKPVIMSTGMQDISSIAKSVEVFEKNNVQHALLECTNVYPSRPEDISLFGISELAQRFPNACIGFSDHSIGPVISLAAVALGATIIERHFTESRYRRGPDIICSMDPIELKYLIEKSKEIHTALNKKRGRKTAEESVYKFARASIVADKNLPAETVINETDIWARRPGTGSLGVEHFDQIIGKRLRKEVKKNQQLEMSDFY